MFALPLAPEGQALEVGLFFSRQPTTEIFGLLADNGHKAFAFEEMDNGDYVTFAFRNVPFNPAFILDFNDGAYWPLDDSPPPGKEMTGAAVVFLNLGADEGSPVGLVEVNGLVVSNANINT